MISYAPDFLTAVLDKYLTDYSSRGLNKYETGLTLYPEAGVNGFKNTAGR